MHTYIYNRVYSLLLGCGTGSAWSVHCDPGSVADHACAVPENTESLSGHPPGSESCRLAQGTQGNYR